MKDAIKNLDYFVGKAVTIITVNINRQFDERQLCDYFVGVVDSIDSMGVMTTHPVTGCKNYYPFANICAISEEQVLDSQNPEHAPVIQEMEKRRVAAKPATPYVDPDFLSNLAKK